MFGQTKLYSRHQDLVDQYIAETEMFEKKAPIPFDLHGYMNYITENHIEDPDQIPESIMKHFFEYEEEKTVTAS